MGTQSWGEFNNTLSIWEPRVEVSSTILSLYGNPEFRWVQQFFWHVPTLSIWEPRVEVSSTIIFDMYQLSLYWNLESIRTHTMSLELTLRDFPHEIVCIWISNQLSQFFVTAYSKPMVWLWIIFFMCRIWKPACGSRLIVRPAWEIYETK